jgi:hypothetical protein
MAKRKKVSGSVPRELARGPVWEGGWKTLGVPVREPDGAVAHPAGVVWVEAESGLVLSTDIFAPEQGPDAGTAEVVAGLRKAIASATRPPAIVRVRDETTAEAIRRAGLARSARVEVRPKLPTWEASTDTLVGYLRDRMPADEPEPFSWKIETPLLPTLYLQAAEYWSRQPWTFMRDNPPIAIELGDYGPRKNARTVYACILGGAGELFGLAVYYSFAGFERMAEGGLALGLSEDEVREAFDLAIEDEPGLADLPPELSEALFDIAAEEMGREPQMEDSMAVYFDPPEEHDPTYLEWLERRGLPAFSHEQIPRFFRSYRSGKVDNLTAREVEAMMLALHLVSTFVDRYRGELEPDAAGVLEKTFGQLQLGTTYYDRPIRAWWPGDERFLSKEEFEQAMTEIRKQ